MVPPPARLLLDPTADSLASWVMQSPETQVVAAIVGFVCGLIVCGILALLLRP